MLVSPFDTLAQRITEEFREAVKDEIRRYKWIEKERGRDLSWEEAWNEWTLAHRENLGQFLMTGDKKDAPRKNHARPAGSPAGCRESACPAWRPAPTSPPPRLPLSPGTVGELSLGAPATD